MRNGVVTLMSRTIVWIGILVVFGIALAQGFTHVDFRNVLASDLDAVAIECPGMDDEARETFSCIRHWASEYIVQMEITLALNSYSNVEAINAWEEAEGGFIDRWYMVEMDGQDYAFYIIIDEDYPGMTETVISISALN